ncbi:bifunctional diguanylate cyclase/phosphodiesterase [Actinoplanes oblitus]|uniref:Bifunctional diguanylate cyclase/phosphodiesterase n=1 Tax=Actinoplanes oblitus TaxID=3040509 RepID=A0ABY8WL54_9ACTN|nr:bifunctional diguanylate cyclase/phosphodiesterase [Actinoplanes oblitus]WIM98575.1 bifunctional diguanylate cyclase/phosphodiesterase [Actinoplanes oblitus]
MTAARWRAWYTPIALCMAVAEVLLILFGTVVRVPVWLVWVPALVGLVATVAGFRAAAAGAEGALRAFWRRLAVAMGAVLVAAISQTVDVLTMPSTGLPPLGARTLLLYVAGATLAVTALLRLPGGARSWRRLTTTLLDVAVVAVTGGIAGSQYVDWFVERFGVSAQAWWLNIAMMAIAVAGVVVVVKIMSARQSPVSRGALWWLAPIGLAGPLSTVLMTLFKPWPHLNGSAAVLPFVGLCGVLAARAQHRHVAGARPHQVVDLSAHCRGTAIPLVATVLTSALLTVVRLSTGHLSTVQVTGTALLLLLVVARQAVALAENGTLLRTVARQAMHDELTGLYSRRWFTAAVAAAEGPRTVVLLDLKEFREINDSLGPVAGDALLIAFGKRLTALAADDAVVARLGGDEFGVLLPGTGQAGPLLTANAEPLHAAGHDVLVDLSIGVAEGEADLYRQAEIALREAASGGHRVIRYDASLERRLTQRATVAADLRRALLAGEFHLLYQPIVELPSGRMTGVESLIRWTRPDGEIVSPADFIPVAEDTGLIVELGAWIIDSVCAQAAAWQRQHGPDALTSIAVNVSARQLVDPALPEIVAAALARHRVPAHRLTVEITETAVFGGGRALATVTALAQLGVSIALDDFGTGHSSLGLLRTCPVNAIKVDKSFVDGLGGTPQQEAIATALTGIAETMGLRTVAEGVETAAQARRLFELGYRQAQGFLFARPLPPAAIDALLAQPHPAAA